MCPRLNEDTLHGSIVTTIVSCVLDQALRGLAQPRVTVTHSLGDRIPAEVRLHCLLGIVF
jgi:hypothetical protein